MFIYCL
jgi:hypothetical protein